MCIRDSLRPAHPLRRLRHPLPLHPRLLEPEIPDHARAGRQEQQSGRGAEGAGAVPGLGFLDGFVGAWGRGGEGAGGETREVRVGELWMTEWGRGEGGEGAGLRGVRGEGATLGGPGGGDEEGSERLVCWAHETGWGFWKGGRHGGRLGRMAGEFEDRRDILNDCLNPV